MRKKRWMLILLVLSIVLVMPLYALANSSTARLRLGPKWYYTPRNIYFKCDFSTSERNAVQAAMNTWNAVKTPDGNSMVSMNLTTANSVNTVVYANSYWEWLGFCDIQSADGSRIDSVVINLSNNFSWSTTGGATSYDLQTVVLHELGHALGVAHCHEEVDGSGPCWSATCLQNVMYPFAAVGKINRTLKEYDTASYIAIYW